MLKITAIVTVVLLAALLAYSATLPDTLVVQRATSIKAPPEKVFALINDLHAWSAWSPYEQKDPAMKKIYSGAPSGKGAAFEWDGNSNVGKGRLEILDAPAPSKVAMRLHMLKPFEAKNTVEFTLDTKGNTTEVAWAMQGSMPYLSKVLSVFIDMDKMVGRDFEAGLANLKNLAEK